MRIEDTLVKCQSACLYVPLVGKLVITGLEKAHSSDENTWCSKHNPENELKSMKQY